MFQGGFFMEELSQEYILSIVFRNAIDKEELLIKKYQDYYPDLKNKELKDMLKQLNKTSEEHIKILKDKMIKLKIQG